MLQFHELEKLEAKLSSATTKLSPRRAGAKASPSSPRKSLQKELEEAAATGGKVAGEERSKPGAQVTGW